jgi:aerobic-type carbon monoxide dehydrogenase small subunit (CoxS/CutS family)
MSHHPDGKYRREIMSRRSFLRGSGVGAAVVLDKTLPDFAGALAQAAEASAAGPIGSITLNVNRVARTLAVEPHATLAEVLRGPLDLTGTKIGCDRGSCSACTVWIDSIPMLSCMMLAVDVGERKVTTIEGLAPDSDLHPVQSAFIARDAIQCGFCTPGLVMSCAALIESNPRPSLDDVKAAIAGHLCRCGTYPHVFAAMQDVAKAGKT